MAGEKKQLTGCIVFAVFSKTREKSRKNCEKSSCNLETILI